jgi:phenylpropionate dioxygenase-like ring-hydroxylating dioxygenase large terminal subunit
MIPNQWYAVLESNEVPRGRPVGVTRFGEPLVFWRTPAGDPVCLRDACPHRGAALSIGRLQQGAIECPFHGFTFDPSGRCTLIPANGRSAEVPKAFQAAGYPAREAHGFIWVWWGEAAKATPEIPWFETLDDTFSYGTIRDHWPVHYSRAIENQLDAVHLPFVHATTIGRGNRTLIHGPLVRWEDGPGLPHDRMNIWVFNELDHGQPPMRADELGAPARRPSLQLQFPNIWHNWIGDDVRVMAAFVPIDDENTRMYVRFYQRIVRAPGLRQLFNLVSLPANRMILDQDKRVVRTQRPKRSDLRMGEKLIPGDGPIIAYRRRRSELRGEGG